jgi:hypothetical protein
MSEAEDDVTVMDADYSLLNKIGAGNLDKVLSPEAIRKAEKVVIAAAADFYEECKAESQRLKQVSTGVKQPEDLIPIITTAFAVKVKAGQCKFDLVAALAKSLHLLCEAPPRPLSPFFFKLIDWHAMSIDRILALKVNGQGGPVGKAILAEIAKIGVAEAQA